MSAESIGEGHVVRRNVGRRLPFVLLDGGGSDVGRSLIQRQLPFGCEAPEKGYTATSDFRLDFRDISSDLDIEANILETIIDRHP